MKTEIKTNSQTTDRRLIIYMEDQNQTSQGFLFTNQDMYNLYCQLRELYKFGGDVENSIGN